MLKAEIQQLAKQNHQSVIANRRHLHANPELSFREYETAAFVKARLTELGLPWEPMTETGIVATITGALPSDQTIALRADMDALPIIELNNISYASQNPSVMHACGHDAHTSSLLGTAFILQSLKSRFGGQIRLIFQPGEETLPGGASLMIKEGLFDKIKPDAVIGQHCMPTIETGKIGISKGLFMASMDEIRVTVRGKGGHGAMPHKNIDPVLIAAQLIVSLQQVVSRLANPTTPTVLSFGKVIANGAINIIPDEVTMEGTFRTFDENWRNEAHIRMKEMAEGIAASLGGSCEFTVVRGYPALLNEDKLTDQVRDFIATYIGKENIVDLDPWMAAEDFAYYSQVADSCFYLLGTGNSEKETTSFLHTPTFNIDEDALAVSTGLMAYIAVKRLGN